jgi:hypothetical protein
MVCRHPSINRTNGRASVICRQQRPVCGNYCIFRSGGTMKAARSLARAVPALTICVTSIQNGPTGMWAYFLRASRGSNGSTATEEAAFASRGGLASGAIESGMGVLDFVSDSLAAGRGIRVLTVVDAFTRDIADTRAARSPEIRAWSPTHAVSGIHTAVSDVPD